MTPLRFITARLMRDQGLLSSLSVAQPDLLAALRGKTVALVGNARALANTQMGEEIDAHDIVIRCNRAPIITSRSHGTRTDWIATSIEPNVNTRNDRFAVMMFSSDVRAPVIVRPKKPVFRS